MTNSIINTMVDFTIGGLGLVIMNYLSSSKETIFFGAFMTVAPLSYFTILLLHIIRNQQSDIIKWNQYALLFIVPYFLSIVALYLLFANNVDKKTSILTVFVSWIIIIISIFMINYL